MQPQHIKTKNTQFSVVRMRNIFCTVITTYQLKKYFNLVQNRQKPLTIYRLKRVKTSNHVQVKKIAKAIQLKMVKKHLTTS